ncbi:hypothetical protein GQ457_11G027730 [Hibiscus cannabinus]
MNRTDSVKRGKKTSLLHFLLFSSPKYDSSNFINPRNLSGYAAVVTAVGRLSGGRYGDPRPPNYSPQPSLSHHRNRNSKTNSNVPKMTEKPMPARMPPPPLAAAPVAGINMQGHH